MIAVDTNILVGSVQTFNPAIRLSARRAVKSLYRTGELLYCFPQNLIEFWNVATRPAKGNGLGLTPEQAGIYVDRFQVFFRLLPENADLFAVWRQLVARHRVSGIQVHDARIVASMTIHQVDKILTFDLNDFNRFENIQVIHPDSCVQQG